MAEQLTAQQRAQLFALQTRQNMQMLARETVKTTPGTAQFTLPKARLLAGATVRVKGKVKCTHATKTTLATDIFTMSKIVRRISLDLNNGFQPFVLSGVEALMYNLIDIHPHIFEPREGTAGYAFINGNKAVFPASASGVTTDFGFTINLPVTTNPRDPIGLILLQNDQTNVTLSIDFGMASEMFAADAEGLTAELTDVTADVMLETFSIPANGNAFPDLSVLKLCNGRKDSLPTAGQQIIKLATGTIYRKLIFRLTDGSGNPMTPSDITS